MSSSPEALAAGRRVALILGSNGPMGEGALLYAESDAQSLAHALSHPTYGFTTPAPKPGIDLSANWAAMSAWEVMKYVVTEAERCSPQDTLLVYFAGHGFLQGRKLKLFWHDTDGSRMASTSIGVDTLIEALESSRANNKLLILDCCHAGGAIPPGFRDPHVTAGRLELADSQTFQLLLASTRLERAREDARFGGGFMTQEIVRELRRHVNGVPLVLGNLQAHLQRQATVHGDVPVPKLFGSRKGDFSFTKQWGTWTPTSVSVIDYEFMVLPLLAAPGVAWAIGRHPVLNWQYRKLVSSGVVPEPSGDEFVRDPSGHGRWRGGFRPWRREEFSHPDQPVVCVSFLETRRVAEHLTQSSSRPIGLPTSLVWDFTAGNVELVNGDWSARAYVSRRDVSRDPKNDRVDHAKGSCPFRVGHLPVTNVYGVSDLEGNIWHWLAPDYRLRARLRAPRIVVNRGEGLEYELESIPMRGCSYLDEPGRTMKDLRSSELPDGQRTSHATTIYRTRYSGVGLRPDGAAPLPQGCTGGARRSVFDRAGISA